MLLHLSLFIYKKAEYKYEYTHMQWVATVPTIWKDIL
jgi:hypothetical protein